MSDRTVKTQLSEQESGSIRVEVLDSARYAQWDAFVDTCPEATFFHRTGWKTAIENAFGHELHYLFAETDGSIHGVLPLGHIKSPFFGEALISIPYSVYGGVAAENDEARDALEKAAESLALRLNVDYLELRNRRPTQKNWPVKDLYVTFRKEICEDPEVNLKEIPRKQRAMVRKGMKAGLNSELDTDINRFYDVYAESVRNLGTPVFSKKYFQVLVETFGKDCEILTITKYGRAVSSVLSFYFRNEVLPYYGGGTSDARQLKANDFMYWELMRRAGARGVQIFDYGRSKKDTGSYNFKKNWGFVPEPLAYQYRLVKTSKIPNVSPTNRRYRLLVDLWKRMPLPLSKKIGPYIADTLA
jgi:FemAB-related protein (PEP-CTERM system-associated)